MELSIIIPIFNAEKTIRKTLEAVEKQQIIDMEVLLIDNASTDNSALICKEFVEKDTRFKYYLETEKGVSNARNKGLKIAKGKYVCFCDADDVPSDNMYTTLVADINKEDVELVMCNYYSQRDNTISLFPTRLSKKISGEEIENYLIPAFFGCDAQSPTIWGTVWRCVFRKDIIDKYDIDFDKTLSFAEDLCFVISYIGKINSVYFEEKNLYFYTATPGSAMLSYSVVKKGLFEERIRLINILMLLLSEKDIYSKNRKNINSIFQEYIIECIGNASIKQKDNSFGTAIKNIKEIVRNSLVKSVFQTKTNGRGKRKIVYFLVKHRCALVLLLYYRMRKR